MFQIFRYTYCLHLQGDWTGSGGWWSVAVTENVLVILEVLREYSHHSYGRGLWLAKFPQITLNNCCTFCHFTTSSIHLNQFTQPEEGSSMLLLQHSTFYHYLLYRLKIWLSLQLLIKHTRTTPDTKQRILNNYRVASTGLDKPVILHGTSIDTDVCIRYTTL